MEQEKVIEVKNLSKRYKLYNKLTDRVKEALNPFATKYHKDFYALHDVSFQVPKGQTLGVIGKNGCGKSTLLKIVTGVLTPTSGQVTANGRISSLLELGAGFNPELTGLENIYFYGIINGFKREEMDRKLDQIIEFADIGQFIGQPAKTYSSGMYVRLAFATAINIDPDVLIVDEALSVGDMRFQKKCLEKIDEFREAGKTILFCAHDMHAVGELCNRVVWLKDGQLAEIGEPAKVISSYVSMMTESDKTTFKIADSNSGNPNYFERNSEEVEINSVQLFDINGKESRVFLSGDDLVFKVVYSAPFGIQDPNYSVIIFRADKTPVGICKTNFDRNLPARGYVKGEKEVEIVLKNIKLNRGKYTFGISVWDKAKKISFANNITCEFEIRSLKIVFGPTEEKCVYFPDVEWRYANS